MSPTQTTTPLCSVANSLGTPSGLPVEVNKVDYEISFDKECFSFIKRRGDGFAMDIIWHDVVLFKYIAVCC
jgi:hypothetical protein